MINKYYKNHFLIVFLISFVLMGVGAFYDYEITEYLYNPDNYLAVLLAAFGSFPLYVFIPVWASCMIRKYRRSLPLIVFSFGTLFLSFVLPLYVGIEVMMDYGQATRLDPYTSGLIAGILASITYLSVRSLPKKTFINTFSICSFSIMFLIGQLAIIYGSKFIFGRDRYADIVTLSPEFSFTPWYSPDFFSQGNSFPSGHVGAAMGILVLLILPFLFEFFKGKQTAMFIIAYAYALIMAVSRMMMGRHFLSDTVASIILMTLLFLFISPLYEKLYMPKERRKKTRKM